MNSKIKMNLEASQRCRLAGSLSFDLVSTAARVSAAQFGSVTLEEARVSSKLCPESDDCCTNATQDFVGF